MPPLCSSRRRRFFAHRRAGQVTVLAAITALLTVLLAYGDPHPCQNAIVVNSSTSRPPNGSCEQVCTLRDAIASSATDDTITFSVSGQISLVRGLSLPHDLTIRGPRARN
ncbi:MAG: hypothetical protein U0893_10925 [Chloroflexota bacterium]